MEVVILGAAGRLGSEIVRQMQKDPRFVIVSEVTRTSPLERMLKRCDVAVDATRAESVSKHVAWAVEKKVAYLLAATGISKEVGAELRAAAKSIPVAVTPNLSLGVAALTSAVRAAAAILPSTKIEIEEKHHEHKKDTPSGTALALARAIRDVRGHDDVAIRSVREGEIVGEHRVVLRAAGERLEFVHVAETRAIFARGALHVAAALCRRSPGLYTMQDFILPEGDRGSSALG